MIKVNINDRVAVKLTEHGWKAWNDYWRLTCPEGVPACIRKSGAHKDGVRYTFHIHTLMNIFGHLCYMGSNQLPFENNEIIYLGDN
jgi:hypothetical protein